MPYLSEMEEICAENEAAVAYNDRQARIALLRTEKYLKEQQLKLINERLDALIVKEAHAQMRELKAGEKA